MVVPHSLNFTFLPLDAVMKGLDDYDWRRLEDFLDLVASQHNQGIVRFYLDFPGRAPGVPEFLIKSGVEMKTTTARAYGWPSGSVVTYPDYENPQLRAALKNFITAFGARYDGDARLAFISAGLLGPWGEWGMWASPGTFASSTVQWEVLAAYTNAFRRTKLVVRTPGAENAALPVGYHEDAFALHTLGEAPLRFMRMLANGGPAATEKWRTQPVGGAINPDIASCLWREPSCERPGQEFDQCLSATHVSWLRCQALFADNLPPSGHAKAMRAAQNMGYELQVQEATIEAISNQLSVEIIVTNRGVAPFYYDWPLELSLIDGGEISRTGWAPSIGNSPRFSLPQRPRHGTRLKRFRRVSNGNYTVQMRVVNPLKNGRPFRFANQSQDQNRLGWLTLGSVRIDSGSR